MKSKSLLISLILVLGIGIIGLNQVQATDPHNIEVAVLDLQQRVTHLEAILNPTVANPSTPTTTSAQTFPPITLIATLGFESPSCQYMDADTADPPTRVVENWCPLSHELIYYIQDARAIDDSLVLVNIQHVGIEAPPTCFVTDSGTLPFPAGSLITTGFILDCTGTNNVPLAGDKLIYTVLSATSVP